MWVFILERLVAIPVTLVATYSYNVTILGYISYTVAYSASTLVFNKLASCRIPVSGSLIAVYKIPMLVFYVLFTS